MTTTGDLMLRTIHADIECSMLLPQPQPALPCLEDDLELRVQADENFAAKLEVLLLESDPLHIVQMELPPSFLSGLHLPPTCRERLIAWFFYFAAGRSAMRASQSFLACGRVLLLDHEDEQTRGALQGLAQILTMSHSLMSSEGPLASIDSSQLDPEANSGHLRVWIALLEAQWMLAQRNLQGAKTRIKQLGDLSPLKPSQVSLSPSVIVQNGFHALHALEGIINLSAGNHLLSWSCFQRALRSASEPRDSFEHSKSFVMAFLLILHLMLPTVLPLQTGLSTWPPYGVSGGADHRQLLLCLARCLIQAVYYDIRDFERRIAPVSYLLRESEPTAASTFLSALEQVARSAVLYRRLHMDFDLQSELGELRAMCPLHIWLSPTLEAPAGIKTQC